MEFEFKIDNTKDCILETEERLRRHIDAVLRREYGLAWEDDPNIAWNKNKKMELENRRNERKIKFPYEEHSTRLLDYSYIYDLKGIVSKNQNLFKRIFSQWNDTMAMFDILGKLRNKVMHPGNQIMKHQHYLCLGICGEFLLAIEHWKKGYSRRIRSYFCDFRFEELEGTDSEGAKVRSFQNAEEWLRSIKDKSIREVEIEQDSSYGQFYKIYLREGEVKISSSRNSRQSYRLGHTQSANMHLISESISAINRILVEEHHPCWTFSWTLSGELDVSSLVSIIEETQDRKPSSSSGDSTKITHASYYIGVDNGNRIRADVSAGISETSNITLVYDDGEPNLGFTNVHAFCPDIILSILYGEIPKKEFNELIKNASK